MDNKGIISGLTNITKLSWKKPSKKNIIKESRLKNIEKVPSIKKRKEKPSMKIASNKSTDNEKAVPGDTNVNKPRVLVEENEVHSPSWFR